MIRANKNITEEYWDEILKEIIEERKEPMFTNEIWEKMKGDYGFPENKTSIEIKLFNLQREGYIKSVLRRKKEAWMSPSGEELVLLTKTKTIDETIASFFEQSLRVPTPDEIKTKLKGILQSNNDDRFIIERSNRVSHILRDINQTIKEIMQSENAKEILPSEEAIFDLIGESIEHVDSTIIMLLIRTQKKNFRI